MSQFYRCDRCGDEAKEPYALVFRIGPHSIITDNASSKVWDLCINCKKAFEQFQAKPPEIKEPRP